VCDLKKVPTIRLQRDFRRIFAEGHRLGSEHLTAIVAAPGEPGITRMSFVVSSKLGGAVTRNRIKRRLRAAAWQLIEGCSVDSDIVVIARPGAEQVGYWCLYDQLAELMTRAGVLEPDDKKNSCSHEC